MPNPGAPPGYKSIQLPNGSWTVVSEDNTDTPAQIYANRNPNLTMGPGGIDDLNSRHYWGEAGPSDSYQQEGISEHRDIDWQHGSGVNSGEPPPAYMGIEPPAEQQAVGREWKRQHFTQQAAGGGTTTNTPTPTPTPTSGPSFSRPSIGGGVPGLAWNPPPGSAFNYGAWSPPSNFSYDPFSIPTAAQAAQEPGYAFRLKEGQRALNNAASAQGLLRSGPALKALIEHGQNFASQEYGNVYNRALNTYQVNRANASDIYDKGYKSSLDRWLTGFDLEKTRSGSVFDQYSTGFGFGLQHRGQDINQAIAQLNADTSVYGTNVGAATTIATQPVNTPQAPQAPAV